MAKYSLIIGRFQPLHQGHIKLIRKVLDEGKNVCVALRDTLIQDTDPYSAEERTGMFAEEFQKEIRKGKLKVIVIPDIESIVIGRKVGYNIERIVLDKETENISATSIRDELNNYAKTKKPSGKIIWGVDGIKKKKSNK